MGVSAADPVLRPAGLAFDAVAPRFDQRFGGWRSVAAQRDAVHVALRAAFPPGARLLDIGGGTGVDAVRLEADGRSVLVTDASPAMVAAATAKRGPGTAALVAAEDIESLAERFDGAYSNFAALNCVTDLDSVARGLAKVIRPGGQALLVTFGCFCPGEMLTEALRGRPRNIFRRLRRSDVPATLGGHGFTVRYHRRGDLVRAMAPWFAYRGRSAIGAFVPPSAAEPWISGHPRLLAMLAALDRFAAGPLARFGDHILYRFERRVDGGDAQ